VYLSPQLLFANFLNMKRTQDQPHLAFEKLEVATSLCEDMMTEVLFVLFFVFDIAMICGATLHTMENAHQSLQAAVATALGMVKKWVSKWGHPCAMIDHDLWWMHLQDEERECTI
jgi:hypothetical protein